MKKKKEKEQQQLQHVTNKQTTSGGVDNCEIGPPQDVHSNRNQGWIQKIQKGVGELGNYKGTIYFTENSLKIIQNFIHEGVVAVSSTST